MARVDVLIDLDDTLAYDHKVGKPEFEGICTLNYSLFLGGREFLAVLQKLDARISFNSQGSRARNTALVSAIAAKHFKENPLEYRVVSGDQESVKRKKLQGLLNDMDMEHAIMLDDLSHLFAVQGEERNFLQVIPNLCPGSDKKPDVKRHYQVVVSNRLVRALGMVLWSLHLSRVTEWSPVEALSAMQWYGGDGYRHSQTHARAVYELGLRAMRSVNPEVEMSLDERFVPWTFPFEEALRDNRFEPDQVKAIAQKLPRLTKEEELLTPSADFDPANMFVV